MTFLSKNSSYYLNQVVYKRNGRFGPRYQTWVQLVYFFSGSAVVYDGDVRQDYKSGDAFLMLPGHTYRFHFSSSRKTKHGWVDNMNQEMTQTELEILARITHPLKFTDNMRKLHEMAFGLKESMEKKSAQILHNTLARACFEELFRQTTVFDSPASRIPKNVALAKAYMDSHFPEELDISTIALASSSSNSHLTRLFRQHIGVTPIKYLWNKRLKEGERLLGETGLNISEIAYKTGFKTPYHFSRMIRKNCGQSPRQYRAQKWQE